MSRIRQVEVIPMAFPDPPLLNSWGVHEPLALRILVILTLEDGTIGLGETSGEQPMLGRIEQAAPRIIGGRVDRPAELERAVLEGLDARTSLVERRKVWSPFEVAALDARGHLEGVSVSDLLGGAVRDRVDFAGYLFFKWAGHPGQEDDSWGAADDGAGLVAQARLMQEHYGFGSFKLKAGVHPPEREIAAMRALAEAFPSAPLRIDPNGAWRLDTALEAAGQLASLVEYLEDPVLAIEDMAEVRRVSGVPLATNMLVVSPETLKPAVDAHAVDVVLADHHYWGGLAATTALGELCAAEGIGLSMHSNSHLGVSLAAMVHAAAATPALTHTCDTHYPWNAEYDIVVPGSLGFEDGAVGVPTGPGLGVELRRDAVDALHRAYVSSGRVVRDDTAYARSVDPGYDPTLPRF
ncbi:enolase C-terminal domain-like protein [Microbacterium stercoris]|uniref:glucarate dehydratase n=1 Tax=Microbacterium stercoris TaxID=2820289 RepID=A0A939TLL1_9MICO|nr:enolase C-terminal domain-like protein [Microbacterium stercoris]MBO3662233.1 glucarate dehydratase [Microbacterium stercoris]